MFNKLFKSRRAYRSRYLWPKIVPVLLAMLLLLTSFFGFMGHALTPIAHAQSSTPIVYTQSSNDYGYCQTNVGGYRYTTRDDCVWQAYYDSTGFWRYGSWQAYDYNYNISFRVTSSSGQVDRQYGLQWSYWYDLF